MRSRVGWALANLFYEKVVGLPEASDLMAWRILLAVHSARTSARMKEKLLDLTPPYDPKGQELVRRYQDWSEELMPVLATERKVQDDALQRQLASLRDIRHLRVTPLQMPTAKSLDYAARLSKKAQG